MFCVCSFCFQVLSLTPMYIFSYLLLQFLVYYLVSNCNLRNIHSLLCSYSGVDLFRWFVYYVSIMIFYYLCHVLGSNVADFYCFSVDYLVKSAWWGEFMYHFNQYFPTFVFMLLLLNHMMFLFLLTLKKIYTFSASVKITILILYFK